MTIKSQDSFFSSGEGDQWYRRNEKAINAQFDHFDWPVRVIEHIADRSKIRSVCELGSSCGWRLEKLKSLLPTECVYYGTDISQEAIESGKNLYPGLNLSVASISETNLQRRFDLVVVNFVLHWIDRANLLKSLEAVDRHVEDGGYLVIGDFLPDYPQKRKYHHLEGENVYTFKQDYAKAFTSLNIYMELARCVFDHDDKKKEQFVCAESSSRACCVLLKKSLSQFYPLV